ncbi:scoloptoxin SSD14-like isoform X2 [Brevipalpus obovatus]
MASIWTVGLATIVLLVFLVYSSSKEIDHKYNDDVLSYNKTNSPLIAFNHAAVVSDAPGCAIYGRRLLERNGSAVDAAIATLLCMGVVVPESMGLGGGCTFVIHDRENKQTIVIDGREKAPLAAHQDMFKGDELAAKFGGKSIAVPGELAAYHEAHKKFGKLPWKDLFDGAIEISRNGFKLHEHFISALKRFEDRLNGTTLGRNILTNPDTEKFYREGELFKRPDLAKTFEYLAEKGAEDFYTGELAKKIVKEIKDAEGIITLKDLENYKPLIYEAREMKLPNGLTLHITNPPGGGVILGFILNVLLRLDDKVLRNMKDPTQRHVLYYHRCVEIFKHAFASRAHLEDPFSENSENSEKVKRLIERLTSDDYAQYIASKVIDSKTFSPSYYEESSKSYINEDHGTSHLSVVDQNGNAVSVTSTINLYWGSEVISESGIIFNNEMDDFSSPHIVNAFGVPPTNSNLIEPGKVPLSSMSPVIITDTETGELISTIGAAGGTRIPTAMALVISENLFKERSIKDAIDTPRIHHQLYPNKIQYEINFPRIILNGLQAKGHNITPEVVRAAVVNGITREKDSGLLTTTFDYRKGGSIEGF